ncbi:RHS repeat-associated core domain-containing protein [Pseudomonas sp. R3-41]
MKCESYEDTGTLRFYQKNKLTTETKTTGHASIFQHGNRLLAMLQHEGQSTNTRLLTTDEQRSLLSTIDAGSFQSLAYTPYGYLSLERRLMKMLGFKGERPDPVTGHYLLGNGYRAFNPVLMRFNSPDSWSPFGKGGINAYAAFDGDPINKNDPNGHLSFYSAVKTLITKINVIKTWQQATTATLKKMPDVPLNSALSNLERLPDAAVENLLGYLEPRELKYLSFTSSTINIKVKANLRSIPGLLRNTEPGTVARAQKFSNIALGLEQEHLPSQVIGNPVYAAIAKGKELPKELRTNFRRDQERIRKEASRARRKEVYGEDAASDTSVDSD